MLTSGNQEAQHSLINRIYQTLGLKTQSYNLLHNFHGQVKPAAGIQVEHPHNKMASLYAAANYGLMSDQPGVMMFHPGAGNDHLHSIRLQGDADQVSQAMQGAGISQFHLIPMKDSQTPQFRAMVYDKGGQYLDNLQTLAQKVGGEIYTKKGTGLFVGGKDKSAAHQHYRDVINRYEGMQKHGARDENGLPKDSMVAKYARELMKKSRPYEGEHSAMVKSLFDDPSNEVRPLVLADYLQEDNHPSADVVRNHSHQAQSDWADRKGIFSMGTSVPVQHGMLHFVPQKGGNFLIQSNLKSPGSYPGSTGTVDHFMNANPLQASEILNTAKRHQDYSGSGLLSGYSTPQEAINTFGLSNDEDSVPAPSHEEDDQDHNEQYENPEKLSRRSKMARSWEEHAPMMNEGVHPGVLADFLDEDNHPAADVVRNHNPEAEDRFKSLFLRPGSINRNIPVQHGAIQVEPDPESKQFYIRSIMKAPFGNVSNGPAQFHYMLANHEQTKDILRKADRHEWQPKPWFNDEKTTARGVAKRLGVDLDATEPAPSPTQMSRRKYAAFSQDPQQQLNISVPLPEVLPNKTGARGEGPGASQAPPAPAASPVSNPQPPAPVAAIKPMPGEHSTLLPYYEE